MFRLWAIPDMIQSMIWYMAAWAIDLCGVCRSVSVGCVILVMTVSCLWLCACDLRRKRSLFFPRRMRLKSLTLLRKVSLREIKFEASLAPKNPTLQQSAIMFFAGGCETVTRDKNVANAS